MSETSYSAASAWGTAAASTEQDLTLPSGLTCRVRKPGMEQIMMGGILEMADSLGFAGDQLTPEAKKKQAIASKGGHNKKGGKNAANSAQDDAGNDFMRRMARDPKLFNNMMDMVNIVTAMTVIIPEVHTVPTREDENGNKVPAHDLKVQGRIYVDSIDFEDKFAIMEFGMGDIQKMQQFRESGDAVGAMEAIPGDGD